MTVDPSRLLQTFDVNASDAIRFRSWPPFMEWIEAHGVRPKDCYRIEVRLLDAPFARFFRYARNADDQLFAEPDSPGTRAATLPPLDVALKAMPPVRTFGDG